MKITPKVRRNLIVGGALFALVATPSFAILGIGDVVFDPTSYASLVSQLSTLKMQYTMVQNNLVHFSLKTQWQTALNQMKQANVASMFGETNGLSVALNTNSPTSSTVAWTNSKVAVNSNASTYLQGQTAGNSAQLSQLAMIEASDSISPDCLTAIGQYRAARSASAAANASLAQQQLDSSAATNSEVQQLNLLNAAEAQRLSEDQAQGTLHACEASQMTVANMQQRNAAAQALNDGAYIQTQQAANPTYAANESGTWTTYLP